MITGAVKLARSRGLTARLLSSSLQTSSSTTRVPHGFQPLVLVACGSFSPPTFMHLRIFEDARDSLREQGLWTIGGYLSPVHDAYGKATLAPMAHRLEMARLAVADSDWLQVHDFEARQPQWTEVAVVLANIIEELKAHPVRVGEQGPYDQAKVALLCGSDLLGTFSTICDDGTPLWSEEHKEFLLTQTRLVCIERKGFDSRAIIESESVLRQNKDNIHLVEPSAENNVSSTVVRRQLTQGKSIRYLVPDPVIEYIRAHRLDSLKQWQTLA